MSSPRTGPRGLVGLRAQLTPRATALVQQVGDLRLMTGKQISVIHFPGDQHTSSLAAVRACSRELARLTQYRLLVRLERRIGGVRAGSSSHIYALGPVGQRVLALNGARRRFREPSAIFVDHTLAVSQLAVDLTLAQRAEHCEILNLQAEPDCWRTFSTATGRVLLRPDLAVTLGIDEYVVSFFVEVDRGTEHLPALLRKCHTYEVYYRSGHEQARDGVFPRVCWIMPEELRAERLRQALDRDRQHTSGLFLITTADKALETLLRRPV
jgi:hypothetical protein